MFQRHYPGYSSDDIEKMLDKHMKETIETLYIPSKLKQIAQFVDANVPIIQNNITNPTHCLNLPIR